MGYVQRRRGTTWHAAVLYYGNLGLLCKVYYVWVSIFENQSKLIG